MESPDDFVTREECAQHVTDLSKKLDRLYAEGSEPVKTMAGQLDRITKTLYGQEEGGDILHSGLVATVNKIDRKTDQENTEKETKLQRNDKILFALMSFGGGIIAALISTLLRH